MNEVEIALQERFLLQKEYFGNNKPVNQIVPLVSVTVATYQHANYIKECLDGILMQKTDFPYEIILGEDGSTDGTQQICQEYAEKYPDKIRLFIRDRQLSQYKGHDGKIIRFNGIWNRMSSRGKYIAWCEGDDYWIDPYKLQKQVDFLETHPDYGLVYTDVNFYFQKKSVMKFNYISSGKLKQSHDFAEHLVNAGYIAPCTWVYRREFLPKNIYQYVDGTFPIALDIWAQSKICFLNETTAVYRHLSESASHSRSLQKGFYFTNGVFQIQKDYIKKYPSLISETTEEKVYLSAYCRLLPAAIALKNGEFIKEALMYFKDKHIPYKMKLISSIYELAPLPMTLLFRFLYRMKGKDV